MDQTDNTTGRNFESAGQNYNFQPANCIARLPADKKHTEKSIQFWFFPWFSNPQALFSDITILISSG